MNKSDKPGNNILPFYQTSLRELDIKNSKSVEKKNKLTYNLENLSHYNLIRNKLDVIEKEIRNGVRQMKKEDEKLNLINEKREKILYDMTKQTQYEIKKLFDEKNNLKSNSSDENYFPRINVNHTISNHHFSHMDVSNSNKNITMINKGKDKKFKSKICLYKNRELNRRKEFKEFDEKENLLIKNFNKRIKSIYDNLKYNNNNYK